MRRTATVLALSAGLLAPAAALAQESPSPSPMKPACGHADFSVDRPTITAGETVTVTARRTINAPDQTVPVTLRRTAPEPAATVRSDTSTATVVEWPLRLGESHRLYAEYAVDSTHESCFPLGRPNGQSFQVDVRPVVTLAATRTAPRDYTFSGRVVPARSQRLSLWRVEADGRRILTARGVVRPQGTYGIDRRFTGSGRFGFQVDVAATPANLWGQSSVRPTVVH